MKDRFFYPLAILIVCGMIFYAMSFRVDNTPTNADVYERQGIELDELFPSPGTTVYMSSFGEEGFAVLSAHMNRETAVSSAGVFGTLGPVYESNFGGAKIRIAVRAKQGELSPSSSMELGYFTSGVGDSEWQKFELVDEYADYSFDFTPNPPTEKGNDYIGIWPDPSGKGGTIDVQSVRVERLRP